MAYTDTTAVKQYLGISATDDDTLLDALIARAQAIIDAQTGRTFEAATDTTKYFDEGWLIDGDDLTLNADLCALTAVVNGNGDAINPSDITPRPRNSKPWYALRLKPSAETGWILEDDIAVTGKWAYMVAADADIQHITIRLTAWLYRQKDNHSDLDRATVVGNMTILPADLPSDIAKLLYPYRRLTP